VGRTKLKSRIRNDRVFGNTIGVIRIGGLIGRKEEKESGGFLEIRIIVENVHRIEK